MLDVASLQQLCALHFKQADEYLASGNMERAIKHLVYIIKVVPEPGQAIEVCARV